MGCGKQEVQSRGIRLRLCSTPRKNGTPRVSVSGGLRRKLGGRRDVGPIRKRGKGHRDGGFDLLLQEWRGSHGPNQVVWDVIDKGP